ncbi:MAG TPA: hypothetical protein VFL57_08705 [Bryobacteraceae bacterium]|nr:hypothetical protein [Bryobacteraceae bacterium]
MATKTERVPSQAAVRLSAGNGEYVRYRLRPRGQRANLSYADPDGPIITDSDFTSQDELEWRLQCGLNAGGGLALTVTDKNGDLMSNRVFLGTPGQFNTWVVGLGAIFSVKYTLVIEHMDGANQRLKTLSDMDITMADNADHEEEALVVELAS